MYSIYLFIYISIVTYPNKLEIARLVHDECFQNFSEELLLLPPPTYFLIDFKEFLSTILALLMPYFIGFIKEYFSFGTL